VQLSAVLSFSRQTYAPRRSLSAHPRFKDSYVNQCHVHDSAQQIPRGMERVRDVLGATADAYIDTASAA
jgi:hypothetical protein